MTAKLSVSLREEKQTKVKLKQMLFFDTCSSSTDSIEVIDDLSMVIQQLWKRSLLSQSIIS